jgi:hypothetical protein
MGFLLSVIALILFVVLYLVEDIVMLFVKVKNRKWYKLSEQRKFIKARKTDVLGNFLFGDLFNAILSKGGYKFGRFGETLSSVFGKKRKEKSLNWLGFIISKIIDCIDFTKWKKGGHCQWSIMTDKEIEVFLN